MAFLQVLDELQIQLVRAAAPLCDPGTQKVSCLWNSPPIVSLSHGSLGSVSVSVALAWSHWQAVQK
eukprot:935379-Rhodomonas_salina.1